MREFEFREEDFGVEELSAGFEDEPELRLTLPEEELPDDPELRTEEPSDLDRLCPLLPFPDDPEERVPPELRVTPDPPEEPDPERTAGEGVRDVPDPLLTPEDPERDVAPERITEDPEDVDLLVALRLTALRIASLFRSKDPLLLDERRVRTPKSVCLP